MNTELEELAQQIEAKVLATDGVAGLYPPHSALRTIVSAGVARATALRTDGEGLVGLREEGDVLVVHIRFAGLATHAGPTLTREVAAAVRGALGARSVGAEVRVQLCAIIAGADLPRASEAVHEK